MTERLNRAPLKKGLLGKDSSRGRYPLKRGFVGQFPRKGLTLKKAVSCLRGCDRKKIPLNLIKKAGDEVSERYSRQNDGMVREL